MLRGETRRKGRLSCSKTVAFFSEGPKGAAFPCRAAEHARRSAEQARSLRSPALQLQSLWVVPTAAARSSGAPPIQRDDATLSVRPTRASLWLRQHPATGALPSGAKKPCLCLPSLWPSATTLLHPSTFGTFFRNRHCFKREEEHRLRARETGPHGKGTVLREKKSTG